MKIAFRMRGTHHSKKYEALCPHRLFIPTTKQSQKSHPPQKKQKELANLVGGFKDFLCSLLFGEDLKFD